MDKQAQDKLWNELSQESKKFVKSLYYDVKDPNRELYDYEDRAQKELLESICGEHNLNPKPQIKTWEDVAAQREYNIDVELNKIKNAWIGYPICDKMIATAKIAKLIDLGYGGMVSEEEWEDDEIIKYGIDRLGKKIITVGRTDLYCFIAFHTPEQREEFWSHESNRKLVEQYYMM